MTSFFALLALGCNAFTFMVLVAGFTRAGRHAIGTAVGPIVLPLASVVAITTLFGSLYLSERLHYLPCKLCWYQRIAAYPLAVLLPIAWFRRDGGVRAGVAVLAALGSVVSVYHLLIERYPWLSTSSSCEVDNPCSITWVKHFGFVTIPWMALAASLLQLALVAAGHWYRSAPDVMESTR